MTKFVCFLVSLPSWWFKGYVLATLWRWFAVPYGLPTVGVSAALGFSLLAGLSMASAPDAAKTAESAAEKTDKQAVNAVLTAWLIPLVFLGLGRVFLYFGTF